jgi:hypothetical protein
MPIFFFEDLSMKMKEGFAGLENGIYRLCRFKRNWDLLVLWLQMKLGFTCRGDVVDGRPGLADRSGALFTLQNILKVSNLILRATLVPGSEESFF